MPDVAISWCNLHDCVAPRGLYREIPTGLTALGMTTYFHLTTLSMSGLLTFD